MNAGHMALTPLKPTYADEAALQHVTAAFTA